MLTAAVDTVVEVGYARMTVAQIIGRARVSRKTFYVITPEGLRTVRGGDGPASESRADRTMIERQGASKRAEAEHRLREARRDVHVAGWVLALQAAALPARARLRGTEEAVLSPPRSGAGAGSQLTPAELCLPGGRVPHDFVRTDASGEIREVEHFDTVRPNAIVEVSGEVRQPGDAHKRVPADVDDSDTHSGPVLDVLVEYDDRLPAGSAAAKLERYDHFLTGWAAHTRRYGRRREAEPVVVFVCRDLARARACARRADSVLRACRAYAGEYPFDWEYPARERVLFASERDIHEGLLDAYGVPRLPPRVRVSAARGDPRAAEALAEPKSIIRTGPPRQPTSKTVAGAAAVDSSGGVPQTRRRADVGASRL
jgi:hypothetical protein